MELLKAVEFESIDKIQQILNKYESIPENQESLYYKLLKKALEVERVDVANLLLDKGCKVNDEDIDSATDTPLHYAVKWNNEELVKKLLDKEASITRVNSNNNTPLHLAFMDNKQPIIKLLVNSIKVTSADDNKKNQHDLSHLHIVCTRKNCTDIIEEYVKKNEEDIKQSVSSNAPRWKGYTALHFAAKFGSSESMKILLKYNGNDMIGIHECKNKTVLDLVDKQLSNFQEMSYLLKNGETNKPILDTELPLRCAVKLGQKICVKLMLRDNADPELIDERTSSTPLHLALYRDIPWEKNSIVEMLYESLKEKSSKNECPLTNKQDDNGASYLHIAVTRNDKKTVEKFLDERPEDVNLEIRLNSQGFSNFAPIHFATKYRHRDMVELLIDRGARVNQFSADGTELHIACELGEHEIIELLLKNQADVNVVRSSDGKTPLHLLVCHFADNCYLSDRKINEVTLNYIVQLIRVGANVNAKDKLQRTPLFQRPKGLFIDGFVDCMKILLDNGADVKLGRFEIQDNSTTGFSKDNCEVFHAHLIKLHTLGLKVNLKNHEVTCQALERIIIGNGGYEANHLAAWKNKLSVEIDQMKKMYLVDDQLTLYEFMHLEPRRASMHTENERCIEIMNKLEDLYPAYANLIKLHYERALMFEKTTSALRMYKYQLKY